MHVCTYICTYVYMYIFMHTWIHGYVSLKCMFLSALGLVEAAPAQFKTSCGDKSPPSLPRPSFLFHLLISVLNTSDGLGGNMTHSGCSSSL